MKLYRIQNKEGNFYRGKAKFTKYGSFFREEQLEPILEWLLYKFPFDDITILQYNYEYDDYITINSHNYRDVLKSIDRNNKIDDILNG